MKLSKGRIDLSDEKIADGLLDLHDLKRERNPWSLKRACARNSR
jgi:hypothetical protein